MKKAQAVETIGKLSKCVENASKVERIEDTLEFIESGKLREAYVKVMIHGRETKVLELNLTIADLPIVSTMLKEIKNTEEIRLSDNITALQAPKMEDLKRLEELATV